MNIRQLHLTHSTDELKKLIAEHPDYPIVVLAGEDANPGDYSTMYCHSVRARVEEILLAEAPYDDEYVVSDRGDFEDRMEEWLWDAIYANSATIWGELANVVDGNGNPMFIPDPVNNGINRILGMAVKEDDSMEDGEVLRSSPFVGYLANVNKEMSVMTEEHVKARTVDYCGYAIVDGGVVTTKAHSLLKYADSSDTGTSTTGE